MRVWQDDAKCRDMDPALFDEENVTGDPSEYAQSLCAGCPVMEACADSASQQILMHRVVGESSGQDRERVRIPVYQSGVVRAGMLGTTALSFPCLTDRRGVHDPDAGWDGDLRGDTDWCPCVRCVDRRERESCDRRLAGSQSELR